MVLPKVDIFIPLEEVKIEDNGSFLYSKPSIKPSLPLKQPEITITLSKIDQETEKLKIK